MAKVGAPKKRDNQLLMAAVWITVKERIMRDRINQLNPVVNRLGSAIDVAKACRKIMLGSTKVVFSVIGADGAKAQINDVRTLRQWFYHAEKHRQDEESYPTLYYATQAKANYLQKLDSTVEGVKSQVVRRQRGRPNKVIKTIKVPKPRGRPRKPEKMVLVGEVVAPRDMRITNLVGWS